MNRDDLDAPYAGAASALCPACGQPKGRGYGCAAMPPPPVNAVALGAVRRSLEERMTLTPERDAVAVERNWRWTAVDGFTERCTGCHMSDATHYHRPQVLAHGDSGHAVPQPAPNARPRQEGAPGRPDLDDIRERLGVLNANTWGFIGADDELWRFKGSHDCVLALAELVDDAQVLMDYALRLEREAEAMDSERAKARALVDTIEQHCPCGARPESPRTHPHNGWCPVAALKTLLAAERAGGGTA